jgi:hypothetical protein
MNIDFHMSLNLFDKCKQFLENPSSSSRKLVISQSKTMDASSFGFGYNDPCDLFLQLCTVKTQLVLVLSDFGRCSSIVIDPFEVVVQIDSDSLASLEANPNRLTYDAKNVENLMNTLVPPTSIFSGEDWAFRYRRNEHLPFRFPNTDHLGCMIFDFLIYLFSLLIFSIDLQKTRLCYVGLCVFILCLLLCTDSSQFFAT